MKSNLSSLELHYIAEELQVLVDQKIDQIYQPSPQELLLQFHISSVGKQILKIIVGKYLFLTAEKEPAASPLGFCMFLRKYLDNAKLRTLHQLGSERILELVFEKKEGKKIVILEFFGQGNIILTDENYFILSALTTHKWKDREIKQGLQYKHPTKPANFFDIKQKELEQLIKQSDKESIVKSLAIELGLGGTFSEEICMLAEIDKNTKPTSISVPEAKKVIDILFQILHKKIKPSIVFEKEQPVDVIPFDLQIYAQNKKTEHESYNQALELYLELTKTQKSTKDKQKDKLERLIEQQELSIKELEQKEEAEREKAELI